MGISDRLSRVKKAFNAPVQKETKDVLAFKLLRGESERGGRHKSFIPQFLWKPPFGYPRYQNIQEIRAFARTPHAWMAVDTVASQCAQMDWEVRIKQEYIADMTGDEAKNFTEQHKDKHAHIMQFFRNPNENDESMNDLTYKAVIDMLELNSGVWQKVFDLRSYANPDGKNRKMVGLIARDGGTFLKNPDIHGMFGKRADLVAANFVPSDPDGRLLQEEMQVGGMGANQAGAYWQQTTEKAAYWQYGYNTAMRPVPFGRQEIVWMEKHKRTDTLYPPSPIEIALTLIKIALYGTEDMLQYYVDNNVPKGFFSIEGVDNEQLDSLREQFFNDQHGLNDLNQQVKNYWELPFTNKKIHFERFQFSPAEMEAIGQQEWISKLIWALIKVTPSELGFTEDSNRATEAGQEKVHRRKALDPILSVIEYSINNQIISEFGEDYDMFEFVYPEHDIDKEKTETDVYKIQLESGIRTVNEVRELMGLEPVEWGDEPPLQYRPFDESFGDLPPPGEDGDEESSINQDFRKSFTKSPKQLSEGIKQAHLQKARKQLTDSGMSQSKNPQQKSKDAINSESSLQTSHSGSPTRNQKASPADPSSNPLILGEGERVGEEDVQRSILALIDSIESAAISLYKEMRGLKSLPEEKALGDDIARRLEQSASMAMARQAVQKAVHQAFYDGHEDIEKMLNRNFQPDKDALSFLQNYTFDNVKSLTEDSVNKLRGVLQRGLMEGSSPDDISKNIQKALKVEKPRAQAIARTELTRARNQGMISTAKKNNISGKMRWKAVGNRSSDRATKLCTKLDGQTIDLAKGEEFSAKAGGISFNGVAPPAHVNCRSIVEFIPDID